LRIGFATSQAFANLTNDDRLAVAELAKRDVEVVPFVWDAPSDALSAVDAVVLRSCWDYHEKTVAFARFLEKTSASTVPLFNSPRIASWNLDKQYLFDLERRGARIPKTVWINRGSTGTLDEVIAQNGLDEVVVKPAVGMLGIDTWRASPGKKQEPFAALVRERAVLVQEFLPDVLTLGEISLVFLGGRFSHAVQKTPARGGEEFRIHEEHGGTRRAIQPSASWLAQAAAILDLVGEPLLYARVDAIPVNDTLVLMELELIDPALFLAYDPIAPGRFADAVVDFARAQ
jgi:glutathione synthase/RimK-type ligase-like ATP-grasp enzyme